MSFSLRVKGSQANGSLLMIGSVAWLVRVDGGIGAEVVSMGGRKNGFGRLSTGDADRGVISVVESPIARSARNARRIFAFTGSRFMGGI